MSALELRPVDFATAREFIRQQHRHLPSVAGWKFGVGVASHGRLCCVAITGRPVSRMLARDPYCLEVHRVASDRTAQHAASKAIAAVTRAALALGYTRVVSYTLPTEWGRSYVAAGWRPTATTTGGEWSRGSRVRSKARHAEPKVRWEFGPGAMPLNTELAEVYL